MNSWWKKKIKVLSPLDGYNLWATSYQHESNPIKNLSDTFIENHLPNLQGKIFLDAGCGTGKFCVMAEHQQADSIVGCDLSPGMIEVAHTLCPRTDLRCGDLNVISFEEQHYDVIISALVLGHLENLKPALTNLLRALKKDGVLLITDFHPFLTMQQAKRTFKDTASGRNFEVQHHLHLFEEYFNIIANQAVVEVLAEPQYNNSPVVFGMRIRKIK